MIIVRILVIHLCHDLVVLIYLMLSKDFDIIDDRSTYNRYINHVIEIVWKVLY